LRSNPLSRRRTTK